jgi:hypothetical protein
MEPTSPHRETKLLCGSIRRPLGVIQRTSAVFLRPIPPVSFHMLLAVVHQKL